MAASIFSAVSLAAAALRWASERTSSATTAKPAPASPARAASTAALSARMLVWKAISSMFFTILATSALEASIAIMAVFISSIVWAPVWAAERASWAKALAFSALSAVLRIITDISSRAALVSATLEPCSLQPAERALLDVASWLEAAEVWLALSCRALAMPPRAPDTARMICQPISAPSARPVARAERINVWVRLELLFAFTPSSLASLML